MTALRTLSLLGATLAMGLIAGVFLLYAHTIMPALHRTDDRTFVTAYQQLDRAVVNPIFMITGFGGALVLTVLAAFAHRGTPAFRLILVALVLYAVAVVVTVAVNVPLNDAIKAAGDPAHIDVATVRDNFHETRWVVANLVRTVVTLPAFGVLAWALVVFGRTNP